MYLRIILLFCCWLSFCSLTAQSGWTYRKRLPERKMRFRVMSWNVENLYDTLPAPDADDSEFLPTAERGWHTRRYYRKLGDLAKTIVACGGVRPLELIALCEVENDSVVHDLCRRTRLSRLGYEYLVTSSCDRRGIDVALLYQPEAFALISHASYAVPYDAARERPTRDVLLATGRTPRGDTLDVFVVHFPSRRGGAVFTEPYRLRAAGVVAAIADSLLRHRACPKFLLMGDFNDEPRDRCVREVLAPHFVSLAADARPYPSEGNLSVEGTYYFRRRWSRIDQILVSPSLLRPDASLTTSPEDCRILALPFLLERTEQDDYKPKRTYLGTRYHGGVSDHLPLFLDLWY